MESYLAKNQLKKILREGVEQSKITLYLYNQSGDLIAQYPEEGAYPPMPIGAFAQVTDAQILKEEIWRGGKLLGTLVAVYPRTPPPAIKNGAKSEALVEPSFKQILHLTCRRIDDLIDLNMEIDSLSDEVNRNYYEMNLLYNFSSQLAGVWKVDQVCSVVLANVAAFIKAPRCCLLLVDEEKEELYISHSYGIPKTSQRISFGEGICGLVASQRESIIIESSRYLGPSERKALLFEPPLVAAPLKLNEKVLGVIILGRELTGGVFTTGDVKLLNAIASQTAVALMNAKLFGELMERNRRSKEILEQQLQSVREQLIQSSRLAAMGQLVASVAHDINNPLTAVIGYTEMLLLEREDDEQLKKRLEVIFSEANRIAGIVRNLRTFAQKREIDQIPINLNYVVIATLNVQEDKLKERNVKVITDLDAKLPQTMADAQQLQQVLINLLSNAMDALDKNGGCTIKIKTELYMARSNISEGVRIPIIGTSDTRIGEEILGRKPFIRLSVSDDGPGIPEDIRLKVFEPFFSTKDEVKGTGLGLSICHGIVSAHNGKIYFETEIGKGTTFFIEIPLIIPPSETDAGIPTESILDSEATAEKILLVDDELAIQNLLKEFLRPEGQVDVASDGMIGWEKLEKQQYDLIILDIKMPKVDGITLYQRIQREKPDLIQKIIFITGDDFDEKTKSFIEKNKVRYITKPFDLVKLHEKIHETLV